MTNTRTRSGFFDRTQANTASVWLSFPGTNQDFYLTFPIHKLEKAIEQGKDHPVGQMYGMGVLKEINEMQNLYACDVVVDGYLVTIVITGQDITDYANKIEAVNVSVE